MGRLISLCFLAASLFSVFTNISSAAVETSKSEGSIAVSSNFKRRSGVSVSRHDAIIYPSEPDEDGGLNRGSSLQPTVPVPSPCPAGALFCESADDYPKDIIKRKLKKQPKLLLDILYEEEVGDDVHNKFGPELGSEKELCTSTAQIVYPNKAQSKEGVFEFVVNDEEHKQGVRVETCTNNGGECNELPAHALPIGYKSSCVQKYILRTLVVFNSSSEVQGFVTKPFEFPSCCSCVITMSVAGYNRFGEVDTSPANITERVTTRSKTVPNTTDVTNITKSKKDKYETK